MIPRLRFPRFSGEWEVKKLGDLISSLDAGVSVNSEDRPARYNEKAILKTSCVTKGVFENKENKVVLSPSELLRLKESVTANTIIISRMNTPQLVGANAFVEEPSPNIYLPDRLWAAKIKSSASPKWVALKLGSKQMRSSLSVLATGTSNSMKNITKGDVLNSKVVAPNKYEQEKIAGFLTLVDERVAANQKKVELLQQYKKGAMQKIFTQKLRFKDESGVNYPDWQEKKLGDIGKTFTGLTGKSGEDFGEGKPYITYMQIFGNSKIEGHFGKVKISPNEKQSLVLKGDIFFTTSSETPLETGYTSTLLEDCGELYLNSFCFGYRLNLSYMIPIFARYLFHSHEVRKKIARLAQGSTRYNISKNEVMKLALSLPSVKEQQQIANFLTSLDDKINLEITKLEQAKLFKKSLLQRMFV